MLSRNFKTSIDPYYDYNKAKNDSDSSQNYSTCIDPEDFKKELIKNGSIPIKNVNKPLIFRRK